MNNHILNFTVYEVIISTLFGLFSILLSNLFLKSMILKQSFTKTIEDKNLAAAVFSGTLIFCTLLLTRTSIVPSVNFLQAKVATSGDISLSFYFIAFAYFLGFFLVAFFSTLFLLFLSSKIFMLATTNVDEILEIQNGNLSVSIMISVSMLAFSLYVKPSLEHFLSGVVHVVSSGL